jgi:hypothetical protein
MSTATRRANVSLPSTNSASGRAGLRRNEFIAGWHELVGVELLSLERACDSTILFEHYDRLFPILGGHPPKRLARRPKAGRPHVMPLRL